MKTDKKYYLFFLISFVLIFVWSAVNPKDYFIWILEVFPAVIGLIIILITRRKFPLTDLVYFLIWIHMIILVVGGHYTYAEMPLFEKFKEIFELDRNYYDRLGHFAQGFIPAMIAREILLRKTELKRGKMLYFIIVSICLAISAMYELIEWWVAELTGSAADEFLATQGDIWDTQWDMFLAFIGANIALLSLSKIHDKFIESLQK